LLSPSRRLLWEAKSCSALRGRVLPAAMASDPKVTVPIGTNVEDFHPAAGEPRRVSLLLYHREGAQAVPLQQGPGGVVGREPPSDIFVSDPNLSRRHARFTLSSGQVIVEDLGSTNGTWLNAGRVQRAVLNPGEEVVLGSVRASVHVLERGSMDPSGLE